MYEVSRSISFHLDVNFASNPPSPPEFPGPLTPPPPWNVQFPPWWGYGYFLELHILYTCAVYMFFIIRGCAVRALVQGLGNKVHTKKTRSNRPRSNLINLATWNLFYYNHAKGITVLKWKQQNVQNNMDFIIMFSWTFRHVQIKALFLEECINFCVLSL